MAIDRKVTHSRKDKDGDITHIGNPRALWNIVSKAQAIKEIESKACRYYTHEVGQESDVIVYTVGNNKHIKTNADKTSKNNLDNLPDC